MILVIGKENCSRCEMVKNLLESKNIEFEYHKLEDLDFQQRKFYIQLGRENNFLTMPLIITEEGLKDIKEVIK